MKKIIYSFILLVVLAGSYVALNSSTKKPNARELKRPYINNVIDKEKARQLLLLGFNRLTSVKAAQYNELREMYKTKYGLTFLGEDEMLDFLHMNDFIVGPSDRYLEDIPKAAVNLIVVNYNKLNLSTNRYQIQSFGGTVIDPPTKTTILLESDFTHPPDMSIGTQAWDQLNKYISSETQFENHIPYAPFNITLLAGSKIFVIGAASKFNTDGMNIDNGVLKAVPPRDPIAVVKVDNGWVELANW